ncbi:hypothetical protein AQBE111736_07785 [Aquirufa beregesia]|uniref:hypothetical protein n=1 Tax=Aquirufa beregesia TaxID=2516556 RepID=UPI00197AABD1|nr:hypothetical protein [Aquirufa beregesia]
MWNIMDCKTFKKSNEKMAQNELTDRKVQHRVLFKSLEQWSNYRLLEQGVT